MQQQVIDLHMHSTCSDGLLTPQELMLRCQQSGLQVVSLTDHDSIAGVYAATVAAYTHGIRVIPGCEISVNFEGQPLHLLAYQFDPHNGALRDALATALKNRTERTQNLVNRLNELGFITAEDCRNSIASGENIGLRHVVRSIIGNPVNRRQLNSRGVQSENEFISALLKSGRAAHMPRENDPPVEEAISLVHRAGGVAVIAHPGLSRPGDYNYLAELIESLKRFGLDGIESFHAAHKEGTVRACHELAKEFGLFETGGSDFHYPAQEDGELGSWTTHGFEPRFPDWVIS